MFKRLLVCFLSFLILFLNSGIVFAISNIEVPIGTKISVSIEPRLNSDRLYTSDIAQITVMEDVKLSNTIMFKKGTKGYITMEKIIHSGSHGRAGYIEIRDGRIKDTYGNPYNIQLNIISKGESKRASAITLSVIGVLLILVPFGIWREGTPAIVSSSAIYEAVVIGG